MTDAKAALAARREQSSPVANSGLAGEIKAMESQFALAMPPGIDPSRLVRDGLTALRMTPKLAACEPTSVLGGLMTMAQLGLRPNVGGVGHGWLLPFWSARASRHEAQLVLGYKGYIELAHRSPKLAGLVARQRHANDPWRIRYGTSAGIEHEPADGDRGPVVGYYSVADFTNGGYSFWYMSRAEVEQHRDAYAKRDRNGQIRGPWNENLDAMAAKTTILQLVRYLPVGGDLALAAAADGGVRTDLSPDADPAEATVHAADVLDGEVVEPEEAGDDA